MAPPSSRRRFPHLDGASLILMALPPSRRRLPHLDGTSLISIGTSLISNRTSIPDFDGGERTLGHRRRASRTRSALPINFFDGDKDSDSSTTRFGVGKAVGDDLGGGNGDSLDMTARFPAANSAAMTATFAPLIGYSRASITCNFDDGDDGHVIADLAIGDSRYLRSRYIRHRYRQTRYRRTRSR